MEEQEGTQVDWLLLPGGTAAMEMPLPHLGYFICSIQDSSKSM